MNSSKIGLLEWSICYVLVYYMRLSMLQIKPRNRLKCHHTMNQIFIIKCKHDSWNCVFTLLISPPCFAPNFVMSKTWALEKATMNMKITKTFVVFDPNMTRFGFQMKGKINETCFKRYLWYLSKWILSKMKCFLDLMAGIDWRFWTRKKTMTLGFLIIENIYRAKLFNICHQMLVSFYIIISYHMFYNLIRL